MKSLLIFLFFISLSFNLISLASSKKPSTSTTSFIQKCCSSTTYPNLCFDSLSSYASQIQNNPKRLAAKSLGVALTEAKSAAQTTARLSRAAELNPREKAALSDCTMSVESSVAQLQRSMDEMDRASTAWTEMEASDVETWTSTALTYAGTCKEAFDGSGMNGNVKMLVQRKIGMLSQLTSNALALVKGYNVVAAARNGHH